MERNIPDLYIEQLVLDELPEEKMQTVLNSREVANRVDEIKRSNREILFMYSPETMAEYIRERMEESEPAEDVTRRSAARNISRWMPLLAAAVLAVMVFTFGPTRFQRSGADAGSAAELTRIKGAQPTIHIYRQIREGSEKLENGAEAYQNDVLQIGYMPAGKRFGAIISIDGRGQVTLHYPEHINESTELEADGEILLPFAYQLDDAPGFERFYFISSDSDFSLSSIILSAESIAASREGLSLDRLPLPESFSQDSLVLMKE